MFELNPLALPGSWWQHLLMLLVSGIIGSIIGYRTGNGIIFQLKEMLSILDINFDKCRKNLISIVAAAKKAVVNDDFKIIEGLGPQIEKVLYKAGIQTYSQLGNTSSEMIKVILNAADPRYKMYDPGTWARQASLAAAGKWAELKEWQVVLVAERNNPFYNAV